MPDMTQPGLIALRAGDYRLVLDPARGGSIARFDWRGEPLFRPVCGPSILDTACFPLVPFSNRIAHGSFVRKGKRVTIAPNYPGGGHPHPLHGFGWLAAWDVVEHRANRAVLHHQHSAGQWPWDYVAQQTVTLTETGLGLDLSLCNHSDTPMPAGLGLHPYFPCDAQTRYFGLHCGEWQTGDDGLPLALQNVGRPVDWWQAQPVQTRVVDTVYTGRKGPQTITWPDRALVLTITPDAQLAFTVVYTPGDAGYFCVEPVTHATDAHNRDPGELQWLNPGETMQVHAGFQAARMAQRIA